MSFEPKHKVELDPPKEDEISVEYLSKCDGKTMESTLWQIRNRMQSNQRNIV